LTPPLTLVKGGIKYLDVFAMHLIPVKGEVKHVNNFDSSFDARQRRSKTPRLCIPFDHVKGVQRHHGFAHL